MQINNVSGSWWMIKDHLEGDPPCQILLMIHPSQKYKGPATQLQKIHGQNDNTKYLLHSLKHDVFQKISSKVGNFKFVSASSTSKP